MAGIYRTYKPLEKEKFEKGDYTKKELIENYIPLVLAIARRFPVSYIERNEAISIGLVELTRVVSNCTITTQAQLTTLIRSGVNGRIRNHCKKYYKRSVVATKDRNGKPVTSNTIITDTMCYEQEHPFETEDMMNAVTDSMAEKIVLKLAIEGGYKNREIADKVGYSTAYVGRLKNELLSKFKREVIR